MTTIVITPPEIMTDHRLSLIETRVLLALYSFRDRNTDTVKVWPSQESIGERCGYSRVTVNKAVNSLCRLGWVTASKNRWGGSNTYRLTVPEISGQQLPIVSDPATVAEPATVAGAATVSDPATPIVAGSDYSIVSGSDTQSELLPAHRPAHTAQTRARRRVDPDFPEWLDRTAWANWRAHRRLIRNPMTTRAEELQIAKLARLRDQGHDPTAIIDLSIERGWENLHAEFDDRPSRNSTWNKPGPTTGSVQSQATASHVPFEVDAHEIEVRQRRELLERMTPEQLEQHRAAEAAKLREIPAFRELMSAVVGTSA